MVCRRSCKPAQLRKKPSRCQCNTEAIRSEATTGQVDHTDVRAFANTERSDLSDFYWF